MKKFVVCAVLAAGFMVGSADAAKIYLAADDGSGKITMAPGDRANIHIWLQTDAIDFTPVAFINAFLDEVGTKCHEVQAVTHGQTDPQWTYDDSAYKVPALIGDECDGDGDEINEYGLVFGSSAGPGFPLGSAQWLIETLSIDQGDDGTIGTNQVFFEGGARKPQAFGPPPTFTPFTTNDFCLGEGIPGFLNMGVGNYADACSLPFEINKIPEPAALSLLAIGGLAALRRRR